MLYGEVPIPPETIVRLVNDKVCPLLPAQRSGFQRSRGELTGALNASLDELGYSLGFEVRHSAKGRLRLDRRREFMWDHTWIGPDSQLALALESEWSRLGHLVLDDFKKLLYAKAPLKVLVYGEQQQNLDAWKMIDCCLQSFRYHTAGERYLIINVRAWTSQCLEACLYEIEASSAGFQVAARILKPHQCT
jgi:hypothetical protein